MFYLQRTEGSLKRNVKRIPCVINPVEEKRRAGGRHVGEEESPHRGLSARVQLWA